MLWIMLRYLAATKPESAISGPRHEKNQETRCFRSSQDFMPFLRNVYLQISGTKEVKCTAGPTLNVVEPISRTFFDPGWKTHMFITACRMASRVWNWVITILPLVVLCVCGSPQGEFSGKRDFSLFSGISMAVPHIGDEHDKSEDGGSESKLHLAISEMLDTRVLVAIDRLWSFWPISPTVVQIVFVLCPYPV